MEMILATRATSKPVKGGGCEPGVRIFTVCPDRVSLQIWTQTAKDRRYSLVSLTEEQARAIAAALVERFDQA